MNIKLNLLEKAILNEIANFNNEEYSFIKEHIPYLEVKSRENTGVGMYVSFSYTKGEIPLTNFIDEDVFLSSSRSLVLDNLKYGLNYELNITKRKIDFLELVTNGESWDGDYRSFSFL